MTLGEIAVSIASHMLVLYMGWGVGVLSERVRNRTHGESA